MIMSQLENVKGIAKQRRDCHQQRDDQRSSMSLWGGTGRRHKNGDQNTQHRDESQDIPHQA